MTRIIPVCQTPDQSVRERIRLRLPDAQRAMWDDVMVWEDEMLAFANTAARNADVLREALLAMYERYVLGRDTITNAAELAEDALSATDPGEAP